MSILLTRLHVTTLFCCLRLSLTITQLPRYYKASFFEYINAFKIYGGYDKED
jgi:hypothetical protein